MEEDIGLFGFLRQDNKKPMEFNTLTHCTVRVDLDPLIFISIYVDKNGH
jgi:hypothetical protein